MTASQNQLQQATPTRDGPDRFVDRAVRLFEFLIRVQQVTAKPVHHVDSYANNGGAVVWLHTTPEHQAVQVAHGASPKPDDPLLVLERIPRWNPPAVPKQLQAWVVGRIDNPNVEPELGDRAVIASDDYDNDEIEGAPPATVLTLDDHPEIGDAFLAWFDDWDAWAVRERDAGPARDLYNEVFRAYLAQTNAPEEWEAVAATGALAWHPQGHDPVLRHCFTQAVVIDFDDDTGRITIRQAEDAALMVELDMLDIHLWPDQPRLYDIRKAAESYGHHPLHRDGVGELARRLMHNLASDAVYIDDDRPPPPQRSALCAFAPAVIVRKRSQQGLIDIFQTLKAQIEERGEVPAGIRILLDPDEAPSVTEITDPTTGAWVEDGADVYLPLPVNDRQLQVVQRVDQRAMTLVQGPPGTGKTHTAAALISHLLAQGKRVLVTAQTDRALKEVRSKLPGEIRDLSVSVIGAGREELSELRVAVKKLSQAAAEYDQSIAESRIMAAEGRIDELKARKAQLARQLLETLEAETLTHHLAGYEGTLAQIAARHAEEAEQHGWIADIVDLDPEAERPLNDEEAVELLTLLRDDELQADEEESNRNLPDIDQLLAPDYYAHLVDRANVAAQRHSLQLELREHAAYQAVAALDRDDRRQLRQHVDDLTARVRELSRREEQWLSDALSDICSGKLQAWLSRHEQVTDLAERAGPLIERLGPLADVRLTTSNPSPLLPHAIAVRDYLASGKTLRLDGATHKPKQGIFTPRVIKDAEPLFDQVLVNGLSPNSIEAIDTFTAWVEATRCLDSLDQAWPASITVPQEDSLAERLAWHVAERGILSAVIQLGADLVAEEERLRGLGVSKPDWNDLKGVEQFARLVDAADGADDLDAAEAPLVELQQLMQDAARSDDAARVMHQLNLAIQRRDRSLYRQGYLRLQHLLTLREATARRDELIQELSAAAATVARLLTEDPVDGVWDARCRQFEDAWRWATVASWIRARNNVDLNGVQATYSQVEDTLREHVAELAAIRAWTKAIERLGKQQRADLMQYAQLVQGFGKTGGKYAARKLTNMREAMQRCRPSVPVWIMPLYRIAQSLQVDHDLFDVIIVDEASQAGLEATFLQYLAPKIVVIGDDKQVSPRAVGVDQSQLQGLTNQFLYDDRYRASWEDPKRSLFDEARMRFGDLITLVEHRRCVPEIIGFSNRIAYQPDDIRLIPVRQTGSDALEPVIPVFVADGSLRGIKNPVNEAEVGAIVEQVEKCLADERYDGMTFGVISLTGIHQARRIEKELMDRLDPREWEARDLRCGTAADFQGSERDVMFVSMVAALDGERRYAPLTADMYVQQFNVAASRARDQMWVFHSIRPDELTNHDDMRYQLLDYCYGVSRRRSIEGEGHSTAPVPEDRLVPPFDSVFEQRVHNRIFDRGYTVIPQYEVHPWRLDLVIVGARGKLAVECDGDRWHGPDRHQADLARQRELQRWGWRFFRVRASEFNIDAARAVEPLWELLDELEIRPSGWTRPEPPEISAPAVPSSPNPTESSPLENASEVFIKVREQERDPDPVAMSAEAAQQALRGHRPPTTAPQTQNGEIPSPGTSSPPVVAMGERLWMAASGVVRLAPYRAWNIAESLPDPKDAPPNERIRALQRIVEVEGPILGERLYQLSVKSASRSRVGEQCKRFLDISTSVAVAQGALVADNPLDEVGQQIKTFRLPGQSEVTMRQLGPRTLNEVPPAELAAVMAALRGDGTLGREAWFRSVLDAYGLVRLTPNTRDLLRRCAALIER